MLSWIFSVILYLGTLLLGLYIDSKTEQSVKKWRIAYVVWLYVFLCFGYMTGSDWRNYELTYTDGTGIVRFVSEPGSYFLFGFLPKILPDFWIFMGLTKCLYLFSVHRLVKLVSERWLSMLALLVSGNFAFMLIQNPLRYMFALTIINFGTYLVYSYYMVEAKHKSSTMLFFFLLVVASILFHNSCVLFLALMPLLFLTPRLAKSNRIVLFLLYMLVVVLTSDMYFINDLKNSLISFAQQYMEMSDYAGYESEDNSAIFSIGNILRIFTFILVLYTRDSVVKSHKAGWILYGITILYYFISRFLILIPTGFRMAIPFGIFYTMYIVLMFYSPKKILASLLILYSLTTFTRDLWTKYDFIPYSNSIPYIVMGHKSYQERYWNNLDEYRARTGQTYELNAD